MRMHVLPRRNINVNFSKVLQAKALILTGLFVPFTFRNSQINQVKNTFLYFSCPQASIIVTREDISNCDHYFVKRMSLAIFTDVIYMVAASKKHLFIVLLPLLVYSLPQFH